MWILNLVLFFFILSLIILVHESGHFLWAKKCGVHIYEFSIGMGPVVYSHLGRDKIKYNLRALPIGGFVQMAGEVYEDDQKIAKKKFMCNKPWHQRLLIIIAGVLNNFIMAGILLFLSALIWGAPNTTSRVTKVLKDYPAYKAGLRNQDTILKINGHHAKTWDVAQIWLIVGGQTKPTKFQVKRVDGTIVNLKIKPKLELDSQTKEKKYFYGFSIDNKVQRGFGVSLRYAVIKFNSILYSMIVTIGSLITGTLSVNALSGPVGIYQVVGQSAKFGLASVIYLIAFLSINVGFINILPFPAFDGGRIFFMLIEKIKGSPVDANLENICHTIGFGLLILLMVFVSIKDIIRLF